MDNGASTSSFQTSPRTDISTDGRNDTQRFLWNVWTRPTFNLAKSDIFSLLLVSDAVGGNKVIQEQSAVFKILVDDVAQQIHNKTPPTF
jgi:stress-induced morphogen